jgi:hypothetical protein
MAITPEIEKLAAEIGLDLNDGKHKETLNQEHKIVNNKPFILPTPEQVKFAHEKMESAKGKNTPNGADISWDEMKPATAFYLYVGKILKI